MKEIPLTNSSFYKATVDDEDYEWCSTFKWKLLQVGKKFYVMTKRSGYMHRMIMERYENTDTLDVDHVNDNGLDNRKENLRLCTRSQNNANALGRGGTSKYRGVWLKVRKDRPNSEPRWIAEITVDGAKVYLGSFKTEKEAAIAWNRVASLTWGEFAMLNEVE